MSAFHNGLRFALCAIALTLAACSSHASAPILPQTASDTAAPAFASQDLTTQSLTASPTTPGVVGAFQVFDEFGGHAVSSTEAAADGPRYDVVWGARHGMPASWRAKNNALAATYYMPQETDASQTMWGAQGHNLNWWQANHPDWVLYTCTAAGTPTKTPAYIPQLPDNVPLDIHNPAVVAYQVKLAANYAIANGYTGLAFDEVLFYNITGESMGSGYYGCGIYKNGVFTRRYTGRSDPAWTADTVAWVKAAHSILKTDAVIGPKNLKLVVNHPAANPANVNEQAILNNVDADLDEAGFSDYGSYKASTKSGLFHATVEWMLYAQAHGVSPLIVNKFDQSTSITPEQLEYSIATYLMGNQGSARVFVGNQNGYGAEQYHAEYAKNYGTPCGSMYGGASYDAANAQIYYRRFTNAIVVLNAGSLPRTSEVAHLPLNHTYTDLEKRVVTNPLNVASSDGYVLLTTNGCQ